MPDSSSRIAFHIGRAVGAGLINDFGDDAIYVEVVFMDSQAKSMCTKPKRKAGNAFDFGVTKDGKAVENDLAFTREVAGKVNFAIKKEGGGAATVAAVWDMKHLVKGIPLEHWVTLKKRNPDTQEWSERGYLYVRAMSDTVGEPIAHPPPEFKRFPVLSFVELRGVKDMGFLDGLTAQIFSYDAKGGDKVMQPCVRLFDNDLRREVDGKPVKQRLMERHVPLKPYTWPYLHVQAGNLKLINPMPAIGATVYSEAARNRMQVIAYAHSVTRGVVCPVVESATGEEGATKAYPDGFSLPLLKEGDRVEVVGRPMVMKMEGWKGVISKVEASAPPCPSYLVQFDGEARVVFARNLCLLGKEGKKDDKKPLREDKAAASKRSLDATDSLLPPPAGKLGSKSPSQASGLVVPKTSSGSTDVAGRTFNTLKTPKTPEAAPPAAPPAASVTPAATPFAAGQPPAFTPGLYGAQVPINAPFIVREAGRGKASGSNRADVNAPSFGELPRPGGGKKADAPAPVPDGTDPTYRLPYLSKRAMAEFEAIRSILSLNPAIFFAAPCEKYHSTLGSWRGASARVCCIINDTVVLMFRTAKKDGNITRGIHVSDIEKVYSTEDGHVAMLCRKVQKFDLLIKFTGGEEESDKGKRKKAASKDAQEFIRLLKEIYKTNYDLMKDSGADMKDKKSALVVEPKLHGSDADEREDKIKQKCQLKKPKGWTVMLDQPDMRRRPARGGARGSLLSASPTRMRSGGPGGLSPAPKTYKFEVDEADDETSPPGAVMRNASPIRSRFAASPGMMSPPGLAPPAAAAGGGPSAAEMQMALQMQDLKHQMMQQQMQLQQQLLAASAKPAEPPARNEPGSPNAAAPAAAAAGSGALCGEPSRAEYRQRVLALYAVHDPTKTPGQIQMVLEQFAGNEKDLCDALVERIRNSAKSDDNDDSHDPLGTQSATIAGMPTEPLDMALQPPPDSPPHAPHRARPAIQPRLALPGMCRALLLGCHEAVASLGDWLHGQYAPKMRTLTSVQLLQRSNVLNGLRWLGEGARDGDVLVLVFCGELSERGLRLPDREGTEVAAADLNKALLAALPEGVRLFALLDSDPPGSVLSLPHCLQADGRRMTNLPGDAYDADVVVLNAVGDQLPAGALIQAFLRVLQHTPQPTHGLLLSEMHRELQKHSSQAAPLLQSSRPARNAAVFGVHGYPDDAPATPVRPPAGEVGPFSDSVSDGSDEDDDAAAGIDELYSTEGRPEGFAGIVLTGETAEGEDDEAILWAHAAPHMLDVLKETYAQATDAAHPNHATAAGTFGSWLMDAAFGLPRDLNRALPLLSAAAAAGDGPSVARVHELEKEMKEAGSTCNGSPLKSLATGWGSGTFGARRSASMSPRTGRRVSLPFDCSIGHLSDREADRTPSVTRLRTAMATYYATHAPHRLNAVNAQLAAYEGREEALLRQLRAEHPDWHWPAGREDRGDRTGATQTATQPPTLGTEPGSMSARPGLAVDGEVTILSDLQRVRGEFEKCDMLAFDLASMGEYLGASGVVVAMVPADDAAKVRFPDGRVLWWPASVCVPHQHNFLGSHTLLKLNTYSSDVASECSVDKDRDSDAIVAAMLRQPPANPVEFAEAVAEKMRLPRDDVGLVPVHEDPANTIRLRFQNTKLANEFVARCRNRADPLHCDLGVLRAEEVGEGDASMSGSYSPASTGAPCDQSTTTIPGSVPVAMTPMTNVDSVRSGIPRAVSFTAASRKSSQALRSTAASKSQGSAVGSPHRVLTPQGAESNPGSSGRFETEPPAPIIGDPPSRPPKAAAAKDGHDRHVEQELALLELRTQLDELRRAVSPEPAAAKYRRAPSRSPARVRTPAPKKTPAARSPSTGSRGRGQASPSPRVGRQHAVKKSLTDLTSKLYGAGGKTGAGADGAAGLGGGYSFMTDDERRREEHRERQRRLYAQEQKQYRPSPAGRDVLSSPPRLRGADPPPRPGGDWDVGKRVSPPRPHREHPAALPSPPLPESATSTPRVQRRNSGAEPAAPASASTSSGKDAAAPHAHPNLMLLRQREASRRH